MRPKTAIRISARVAELRTAAKDLAAACQHPLPVDLPSSSDRRRRAALFSALIQREREHRATLRRLLLVDESDA